MERPGSVELSGKRTSLQRVYEDQRQAIDKLLAEFQARASGPGGAFSDFVRSEMSGHGAGKKLERAAAERVIRELQNLLTKTQSVAGLGQEISALVHEGNQPLTAISNYAAGCRHLVRLGRQEELDGILQKIIGLSERAFQSGRNIRELVGESDPAANASVTSSVIE